MFIDLVARWSERLLSTRSFELIVVPALADLEYEGRVGVRGAFATGCAIAGAVCDDLGNNLEQVALFMALALLPAAYYFIPLLICVSPGASSGSTTRMLMGIILVLSAAPAIVCYWPAPLTPPVSEGRTPCARCVPVRCRSVTTA